MLTRIMKWFSIAVLLAAAFWRPSEGYGVLFQFVVSVGAILVVVQAVRARKYFWGIVFTSIAVIFNPIAPIVFSRQVFLWLDVVCLAMFAISLSVLKSTPIISVAGIINPGRRIESL
jgi:hypothetical protein